MAIVRRELIICSWLAITGGCGSGEDGTEADQIGVASSCDETEDCPTFGRDLEDDGGSEEVQLECLQNFRGGYCGIEGCMSDEDCPSGARCVAHTDGMNYCFRVCSSKGECNLNRGPDDAANCSANVVFVGPEQGKACVPPSA